MISLKSVQHDAVSNTIKHPVQIASVARWPQSDVEVVEDLPIDGVKNCVTNEPNLYSAFYEFADHFGVGHGYISTEGDMLLFQASVTSCEKSKLVNISRFPLHLRSVEEERQSSRTSNRASLSGNLVPSCLNPVH